MPKQLKEETWNPDRVVKALQDVVNELNKGIPLYGHAPVIAEARAALREAPLKGWTVLLLTPAYLAVNFGEDTFYTHVQAETAARAIQIAKEEASEVHHVSLKLGDWYVLAVFEGFQFDVKPHTPHSL